MRVVLVLPLAVEHALHAGHIDDPGWLRALHQALEPADEQKGDGGVDDLSAETIEQRDILNLLPPRICLSEVEGLSKFISLIQVDASIGLLFPFDCELMLPLNTGKSAIFDLHYRRRQYHFSLLVLQLESVELFGPGESLGGIIDKDIQLCHFGFDVVYQAFHLRR